VPSTAGRVSMAEKSWSIKLKLSENEYVRFFLLDKERSLNRFLAFHDIMLLLPCSAHKSSLLGLDALGHIPSL
jgi:predicted RNA-binding protein